MDRAPSIAGSSGSDLDPGGDSDLGYELDLKRAIGLIKRSQARRVGLQAPEGLKRALPKAASRIAEETGAEVLISADPCYGACDVDMRLCQEVELLFHLGHAGLGEEPERVVFLEARMNEDLGEVAEKAVAQLRSRHVGVASTVQHIHRLDSALQALAEHGIEGHVGPASGRIRYPGQVLGCCYITARTLLGDSPVDDPIEEFLFIGTGQFHPLGIALATGKRVIAADPVSGEVSEIDPDPMLRRRFRAISKASEVKEFAVLISKKPGQRRVELAERMMALGRAHGRDMYLVYIDNIEPELLLNLGVKAAVSTACPRVALDDAAKYRIPILTPPEFEVLLGERSWEEYQFDEIDEIDVNRCRSM